MMLRTLVLAAAAALAAGSAANAAGGAKHPHAPEDGWPFEGIVGQFEMESVQRGFQVYTEVCASCHSMKLLSYRNLGEPGGPFYDPDYPNANENPLVKQFAAEQQIEDGPDEFGDMYFRPGRPSDTFKSPYANEAQARAANGGALPPDFSVIAKAREGGASYIYSLISGYPSFDDYVYDENGDVTLEFDDDYHGTLTQPVGQYYNPWFSGDTTPYWEGDPRHAPKGGFLAMGPQLTDGRVEYLDGTEATIDQMSYDIAQFLAWASEPTHGDRKSLGLSVMIYLGILAVLLWFSYQRIWRNVGH